MDDNGQVSTEQLVLLTAVIGTVLVVGYVVKTQLSGLSGKETAAANETFNKSI
jgi:uncharacterized protein (UPF0333 family)